MSTRQAGFVRNHPECHAWENTGLLVWFLSHRSWMSEKRHMVSGAGWAVGKRIPVTKTGPSCHTRGGMLDSHSLCLSASKAGGVLDTYQTFFYPHRWQAMDLHHLWSKKEQKDGDIPRNITKYS